MPNEAGQVGTKRHEIENAVNGIEQTVKREGTSGSIDEHGNQQPSGKITNESQKEEKQREDAARKVEDAKVPNNLVQDSIPLVKVGMIK